MVRHGFTKSNGARPTSAAVFRVAIVMTDGKSNEESSECQWNTLQAAEAVHALNPPVLVYVIGVTDNINQQELEDIATSPEDITYLDSFNKDFLQETQEEHIDEVCKTGIVHVHCSPFIQLPKSLLILKVFIEKLTDQIVTTLLISSQHQFLLTLKK